MELRKKCGGVGKKSFCVAGIATEWGENGPMETESVDSSGALIGHSREDGQIQPLEAHLRGVASLAGQFAEQFSCRGWGVYAGLLHDDGKALPAFQRRIRRLMAGESAERADHSTPGAKFVAEKLDDPKGAGKMLSYCIAGHHTGLPDGLSGDDDTCLSRRIKRSSVSPGLLANEAEPLEIPPFMKTAIDPQRIGFQAAFFTRMIFSCLVDGDFLDTELFVNPERSGKREHYPSIEELKVHLDRFLHRLGADAANTVVNRYRAQILEECRDAASGPVGLKSLTVPTGGGKTLSSMAFAMDHAVRHGLRRIIYVIPYTSIIEQTAEVFRDIFGPEAVLEHHSNLVADREDGDDEYEERRRIASENWTPPIVVTTNVQFFESFFSNRSSKTRRLHNVAKSVVILDEAQMLPVPFLKPTLEVIQELALNYKSTIVLCTATQPALHKNDSFQGGLESVEEIVRDPEVLEGVFKRVDADLIGEITDEELADRINREQQVLCIVNTRGHARRLVELIALDSEDAIHLSALMCPVHRRKTIGEIKRRLQENQPCRVVSTQLVEAGVDLDFPVVYRAIAGIDSIIQAAGRCNREGKLPGHGKVHVFRPENGLPAGYFRQNAQVSELILKKDETGMLRSQTVRRFFQELYWLKDGSGGLDKEGILDRLNAGAFQGDFPFKTIASAYRLIADEQVGVIVPYDKDSRALCDRLKYAEFPGGLLRRLQPYTVSLRPRDVAGLMHAGYIEEIGEERYVVNELGMKEAYDEKMGLNPHVPGVYVAENLIL